MKETKTMKKLLMAVAIVCTAIGVQASSVDWSFSEQVKKDNYGKQADLTAYTAYLIDATTWEGFTALATDAQTYDAFSALTKSGTAAIVTTSGNWTDSTTSKYGTAAGTTSVSSATSGDYYVVLAKEDVGYYAGSKAAGTAYDHAAEPAPSHYDPKIAISAGTNPLTVASFSSFAGGGDTPEPTSGLLLLLGVAGLALRRKAK